MHEDDVRLRSLIDDAKSLAKRCGYPTAGYFLDLAAADIEKTQLRPSPSLKFKASWRSSGIGVGRGRGCGARERDSLESLKATPTLLVRLS